MNPVAVRDQWRCVRCGRLITDVDGSVHHRILGRRSDNRTSNLILLCGSGTAGCHGWAHHADRAEVEAGGWIVSKYSRTWTGAEPVLYDQPGRKGWILLDDDGGWRWTDQELERTDGHIPGERPHLD